jgi:hypothetical protein
MDEVLCSEWIVAIRPPVAIVRIIYFLSCENSVCTTDKDSRASLDVGGDHSAVKPANGGLKVIAKHGWFAVRCRGDGQK